MDPACSLCNFEGQEQRYLDFSTSSTGGSKGYGPNLATVFILKQLNPGVPPVQPMYFDIFNGQSVKSRSVVKSKDLYRS